jgi:hypothetical protein
MKKLYYIKEGRRYVPVSEYDSDLLDAFPKGNHLVMSYPGGTSRRFNIDPNYAAMIAAGRVAEDAISKTIMEKSALRVPERKQPLTPEQAEAWRRLSELFGDERYALEWCSYREAAEAGVKAMQDEADKLMKHPSVRRAFDNFVLMCQLTKESERSNEQ